MLWVNNITQRCLGGKNLGNYYQKSYKKKKTLNITLYVVRAKGCDGKKKKDEFYMGDSSPCVDCYKKMIHLGVKTIVYSDENNKIVKTKLRDYNPKVLSCGRRFINNNYSRTYNSR
jgi:hypothetical protein